MTSATGSSPLTEADEDVYVPVEAGPEGTEVAEAVEEVDEPVVVEAVVEELETPAEPEVVPMEVEEVQEEVQEVEKVEERVPTPPAPPPRAITPPPAPVDDLPSVVEAELPPPIHIVMIPAPPAAPIASTSTIPALPTVIPPSPLKRRLSSPPPPPPTLNAFEDPTSAAWKAAKEASQWNGLLRWARRARGPQWDWASGMYHVDVGSDEYYAGVVPLPAGEGFSEPQPPQSSGSGSQVPLPLGLAGYGNGTQFGGGSPYQGGGNSGTYDSGRSRRVRGMPGK